MRMARPGGGATQQPVKPSSWLLLLLLRGWWRTLKSFTEWRIVSAGGHESAKVRSVVKFSLYQSVWCDTCWTSQQPKPPGRLGSVFYLQTEVHMFSGSLYWNWNILPLIDDGLEQLSGCLPTTRLRRDVSGEKDTRGNTGHRKESLHCGKIAKPTPQSQVNHSDRLHHHQQLREGP